MPMMNSLYSMHRPHNLAHPPMYYATHSPTPARLHLRSGDSQHPTELSPIQRVGFLPTADFESNGTQRISFIGLNTQHLPSSSRRRRRRAAVRSPSSEHGGDGADGAPAHRALEVLRHLVHPAGRAALQLDGALRTDARVAARQRAHALLARQAQ
jgi:hypothetical protein